MADAGPRYARRSIRLPGHDYAAGSYLVTICTQDRLPLFGQVDDATIRLSATGTIVARLFPAISRGCPWTHPDADRQGRRMRRPYDVGLKMIPMVSVGTGVEGNWYAAVGCRQPCCGSIVTGSSSSATKGTRRRTCTFRTLR